MKAMILAAGRGERMRPLTDDVPKPLLRAGGKPLIAHHVQALARAGIREVIINLAWQGERIRDYLGDGSRYGLSLVYSDEGAEALETGGGVYRVLPRLAPGPFWLVNGDVFCAFEFSARDLGSGIEGHLVLVPNPDHHPAGDFSLVDDLVRPRNGASLTYSGIALLDPKLFQGSTAGKFPLAPLLVSAARRGVISGERFDGLWTDVGTPARLAALERALSGR
jgi:MurNAc alpha-1-phosphate uridylyltransferase